MPALRNQANQSPSYWLEQADEFVQSGGGSVNQPMAKAVKNDKALIQADIYAGLIENMDTAVGRVLKCLDDLGLTDHTIVIFTGDNGGVSSGDSYSSSELPYRGGKGRQWECGLRVPFSIQAPGVTRPGSTTDTPVIVTDFYPTILQLAGLPLRSQQHADGVSLVPKD